MGDRTSRRERRTDRETTGHRRAERARRHRERRSGAGRYGRSNPGHSQQSPAGQQPGQQSWTQPTQQSWTQPTQYVPQPAPQQPGMQPTQVVQAQPGVQSQPVVAGTMSTVPQFQSDPGYAPSVQTHFPVPGQPVTAQAPAGGQQPMMSQGTTSVGQLQLAPQQQLVEQPAGLYPEQFADHLSEELRICLDDCIDVSQVAGWAADRCLDEGPSQAQCARLCNEAAELGSVAAQFISRDAINTPVAIEAYLETAETALEELQQFDQAHTSEAATVIGRSIDSSIDALDVL